MNNFNFYCIPGKNIFSIMEGNFDSLFSVIKEAYIAHSQGQSNNPKSYFLKFDDKPNARIIALPASLNGENKISGLKWIASYPDNVNKGFPRASAVIVLNDYETGYPLCCLEGSVISAFRTACSAVLAAETFYKANKKSAHIGFIGNGLIAKYIYNTFFLRGWGFEEIMLFDRDIQSSTKLQSFIVQKTDHKVSIVSDAQKIIQNCDLIVLSTTAAQPYINDAKAFSDQQLILNISLRDIDRQVIVDANNITDDIEHVLCAETSLDLAYKQYKHHDFIKGTLGEFLIKPFLLDTKKPIIFSPMGMGILDIACAQYIYQRIHSKSEIKNFYIEDFFFDLNR